MKYGNVEDRAKKEIENDLAEQATATVKEKLIEIDLAKKALAVMEEQLAALMEKDVELEKRSGSWCVGSEGYVTVGCTGTVIR